MSNLVNNINELSPNVHSPQPSDTALGNTTDQRSTLAHLQSCNSPSSDSDVEDASFLRRPPHPLGTAQSVSTSLTTEQFQHVLLNITESIRSTTTQSAPTEDNPFAVARAEFYISQGLTFKFDGTHEKLAPWIKKFKALRSNALWHDATYIMHEATTYDILSDFMKIKENVIKPFAKQRTSPGNQASSLKPEHQDLFYARILGKVVISSITDEFYTTLQNYAGDEMAGDGPLLLWLILTHFHTSTITYQEQLKQQIRTRSLATDHNEDVEAYLLWLRHHLDVLATTSGAGSTNHNDLMDPIFQQLLTTKSTHLRRLVEDKHLAYHSEEQAFTPASLVESLEKLCRALRQSNQLYTTVDTDIMALLGAHKTAHIVTPPTNKPQSGAGHHIGHTHSGTGHNAGNTHRGNTRSGRPQWYDKPPKDLNQTHQFEKRVWHWCPRCGTSSKWVCAHSASTHTDNFVKKRKGDQPQCDRRPSPTPPTAAHVASAIDSAEIAKMVAAQVQSQFQAHFASSTTPAFLPPPPASFLPEDDPRMGAEEW